MRLRRTLTTVPLVFVMYFNISGGPFSTEGIVAELGPGLTLLLLVLIPIVWAVPETLIIGELASMLPVEGGYYRWVGRAFGPFWAFQNGWWTWLYSLVDMAIYPVLFNQYLAFFFPDLGDLARWGVALAIIWGATALNLRGALPVGRVSVWAGSFVIVTFLLLTIAAVPQMHHAPWNPFSASGDGTMAGLGVGMAVVIWNFIGWDNASTVQGEVVDAGRTYPRALALALPLIALGYLIPVSATLAATDWSQWRDGGWPAIAIAAGGSFGRPLSVLIALAGMISALALFNALLLVYSRIPLVVAEDRLLPTALGQTDARGTPRNAIIVSAICYSVFALLPFSQLVVADVLLYAMAIALEFASLVVLRRREPLLRGSFRIPVGQPGVIALAALPMIVLLIVVGLELRGGASSAAPVMIALGAAALGPILYRLAAGRVTPSSR